MTMCPCDVHEIMKKTAEQSGQQILIQHIMLIIFIYTLQVMRNYYIL